MGSKPMAYCMILFTILVTCSGQESMNVNDIVDSFDGSIGQLESQLTELADTEDDVNWKLTELADNQLELEGSGCPNPWTEYRCRHGDRFSNQCLPLYTLCDGYPHCPQGEDEAQCDLFERIPGLYEPVTIEDTCTAFPGVKRAATFRITLNDSFDKQVLNEYAQLTADGTYGVFDFPMRWSQASKSLLSLRPAGGGIEIVLKFKIRKRDVQFVIMFFSVCHNGNVFLCCVQDQDV